MTYFLFPSRMEELFIKVLPKSKLPLVKQMELLNDEITYKEFLGVLVKKLLRYTLKNTLKTNRLR